MERDFEFSFSGKLFKIEDHTYAAWPRGRPAWRQGFPRLLLHTLPTVGSYLQGGSTSQLGPFIQNCPKCVVILAQSHGRGRGWGD